MGRLVGTHLFPGPGWEMPLKLSIGFDPPRPRDKDKMNKMLLALLFILRGVYIWDLPGEVLQALPI